MTDAPAALGKAAVTFAPDAQAPGHARRFIIGCLVGKVPDATLDVAALLLSELVTNAVVHAASAVEVAVTTDGPALVVEVRDADTGPLVARAGGGSELDEGGRGFVLIDRLADSWGTEHGNGRKTVWFRLLLGDEQRPKPKPAEPVARSGDPVAAARRSLRALVLSPSLEANLTLREQLREVVARVLDVLPAEAASLTLLGDGEPLTVGAAAEGTTSSAFELVVDDRRLGELTLRHRDQLAEDEDAFARLAADRLALLAAENGVLRSGQSRGADQDVLSEATELLAGSTSVAVSLTLLTQIVVPRLAEWCAALAVDDRGRPRRVTANHRHEHRTDALNAVLDSERELRSAVLAAAAGRGPQRLPATIAVDGQRSHVVVLPLTSRSRTVGVLVLGGPDQLDPVTYVAGIEFARRAALAVENARLHEEQAAHVAALQSSLLPAALPEISGLELASRYHSASPGMSVGGDFYDVVALVDGGLVLTIGDVCGKGAEAAAVTGMSRDVLRLLVEDGADPVPALRRLNRALLSYPASSRFCTIALARLDRRGERLVGRLCLGGHPEPVVLRADGHTELVGKPGDVLGILDNAELDLYEMDVELDVGDALVLYTDGVTERRDGRRMFGQYGLRKTLTDNAGGSADALADAVERAAEAFVDAELRDDLAILVVRRVD